MLAVITAGRPNRQAFFDTVEAAAAAALHLDRAGHNVYYAISSFLATGSRKQDNVRATRSLVLDVDCGSRKPFPTWREGLQALYGFVAATGLPPPAVVHSGNGLHVYWVLEEELPPAQWVPLATALKIATVVHGFPVDAGLTANSAVVLRPVGTHNPKNGREVRLLLEASASPAETIRAALHEHMVPARPQRSAASPLALALRTQHELPPADPVAVASKCQQVLWATEHQPEVTEPLWYAVIGIAAFCSDPAATVAAWSQNHPEYSPAVADKKLAQWTSNASGPSTCARIASLRPGGCKGCPWQDKITTPAQLGAKLPPALPTAVPAPVTEVVPLPPGFRRTAFGIAMTVDDVDIVITPFDVHPVSYGMDEAKGYEVVRFLWDRKHVGWSSLAFRQALLTRTNLKDFTTAVADTGIVLPSEKQTERFQIMLRSYMDELRAQRTTTDVHSTMGWKVSDTQFVLGDTTFHIDKRSAGSVTKSRAAISRSISPSSWATTGDAHAWSAATGMLKHNQLFAHLFAIGVSLSAPLYAFSGLRGLTISLCGPTGSGKTLAQLWQQSVWGNPVELHYSAKFTPAALFARMAIHNHLPMTIDEATLMDDATAGDFLYWVSQGRDKARLTRAAEERPPKTWALPVTLSTNRSWQNKLLSLGLDTDAQRMRLLELHVDATAVLSERSGYGRQMHEFLRNNYGHAGRALIEHLVLLGPQQVQKMVSDAPQEFTVRYQTTFTGTERYWEQAVSLAALALRLAQQLGVIAFSADDCIPWALDQLCTARQTVTEERLDVFDILFEYITVHASMQVQVFHIGMAKPTVDPTRVPRSEIRLRFDIFKTSWNHAATHGTLMIDRAHFRAWLARRGVDSRQYLATMKSLGAVATPRSDRAVLSRDTPLRLGQCSVLGINLGHERLIPLLDVEPPLEDMKLGELRQIRN